MPAGMRGREGNMKKKLLGLVACVATLALSGALLAGCSGSGDKTGGDSADGKETLTVGFDQSYPPYGFVGDDGKYTGFDLDLAQAVCDKNGWELKLSAIDWDAKDMELNSGTISCIWNGFTMNGREDDYTWSEPSVDNSQVFVVKEDSGIASFDDLAGKTVAVQTDSSAQAALDEDENADLKNSFKELLVVGDYNTAFMNLEAGAVDAIAMDIGVANYQLESRGGGFTILDEPLAAEQYAIGFKKGNTELRDKVQKTLDEMAADGTFEKIAENWDLQDSVTLGK